MTVQGTTALVPKPFSRAWVKGTETGNRTDWSELATALGSSGARLTPQGKSNQLRESLTPPLTSMLAQLPTELKISIIEHVSTSSLPAVLRTNSAFREIAEPLLYSAVKLSPFTNKGELYNIVIECFRVLVARSSAARAVGSLHVSLYYYEKPDDGIIGQVFEAFGEALVKLVNLQRLELPGWDDRFIYPIGLPRGSALQSLQYYLGPPEVVDNIQSDVLVTLRIQSYRPRAAEASRALLAAARSSAATLRVLDIGREERDDDDEWLELIPQIPSLFPNVRFLGLGSWYDVDNDLIDQVVPSLAVMECLRLFYIGEGFVMEPEREVSFVKRLHEGCPQLRGISFGNQGWCFDEELRRWVSPYDPSCEGIWAGSDYPEFLDASTYGWD